MSTVKIMTNISWLYFDFLDKEAKERKSSKRKIIEESLSLYIENKNKQEIQSQYQKMSQDKDYLDEMKENTNYLSYL